jgi:hypothetical protein
METSLNIEVRGTGRDNSSWKRLAQTQQTVEMGLRWVLYMRLCAYVWVLCLCTHCDRAVTVGNCACVARAFMRAGSAVCGAGAAVESVCKHRHDNVDLFMLCTDELGPFKQVECAKTRELSWIRYKPLSLHCAAVVTCLAVLTRACFLTYSGVGKEEKHTREGYKTGQKRQAFKRLEEVGDNLNLHMQVVQRAKEE